MKITFDRMLLTEYLEVKVFTLKNDFMEVKIMDYGGIVMSLKVPDREGNLVDVALGFNAPEDYVKTHYLKDCLYFGAIIGRYANRIRDGRFYISGIEYQLDKNNGNNHLHGGYKGFDKIIWDSEIITYFDLAALRLTTTSKDGDQGYPGKLDVSVIYYIENENGFGIDYRASTDKTTPINLTWHGYFNLSGEGNGDILDHNLKINASQITEVTPSGIPTGNILQVTNTPYDFTEMRKIGDRIKETPSGYDHNYARFPYGDLPKIIAIAQSDLTGIEMSVWTTQPGVQLYTGNSFDGTLIGKSGNRYFSHSGFCLETQHFPDSPNNPHFPRVLLEPGETFQESTIYRFDAK